MKDWQENLLMIMILLIYSCVIALVIAPIVIFLVKHIVSDLANNQIDIFYFWKQS